MGVLQLDHISTTLTTKNGKSGKIKLTFSKSLKPLQIGGAMRYKQIQSDTIKYTILKTLT